MQFFKQSIFLLLIALLSSCGRNQDIDSIAVGSANMEPLVELDSKQAESNSTTQIIDLKIIKEGQIRFETSSLSETRAHILKSIAEVKGYISNDNIQDYSNNLEHTITIRVPANAFETLLNSITTHAKQLESKSVTSQDVTEEFIDVEARIQTKKVLEIRYKELLQQARSVEDILNIEKEIGNLRSEIESFEGRLQYLKNKLSFSTLTIVFFTKTDTAFGFNSKIGTAFSGGWSNLLWFCIGIVNLWPFFVLALVLILSVRKYRAFKKQPTEKPKP